MCISAQYPEVSITYWPEQHPSKSMGISVCFIRSKDRKVTCDWDKTLRADVLSAIIKQGRSYVLTYQRVLLRAGNGVSNKYNNNERKKTVPGKVYMRFDSFNL